MLLTRQKPFREKIPPELNKITGEIIDAAYVVFTSLGPGLLESVYEICLFHELIKRGVQVERQVNLPIVYDNIKLDAGLRLDMLVEGGVVVEIKSAESILPVHQAQLLTYLKLSGHRLGLLLNFNVTRFKDGVKRLVL